MDSSYSRREPVSAFDEADDSDERVMRDDPFAVFDAIAADIASEVDLVDELERILRGEAGEEEIPQAGAEASAPARARADDEAPAARYDDAAGEEPPFHDTIPPAVDLDAVDDGEFSPEAAGFWRPQATRRAETPLRERRAPRTDLIIMASLAIVVLGLGAFAAFGGWGGAQPVAGIEAAEAAEAVAAVEPALGDVAAVEPAIANLAASEPELPPVAEEEPAPLDPALDPDYAAPALDPADLLGAISGEAEVSVSASPDSLALVEPKDDERVPESEPVAEAPPEPAAPVRNIGGPLELMPEALSDPVAAAPVTIAEPVVGPAEPAAAPAADPVAPSGSATVSSAVNMRGGPDNGAPVVTVVPAGSTVNVVACAYWCEVSFNGQSGWIYRDFLQMR